MLYALLVLFLVAADQLVKYLVLRNISVGEHIVLIPGVVELTHVDNTGAAFSLLSNYTWVLALVSLVVSVVLAAALFKGFFKHPLGKAVLSVLLAGAVGNLIDRVFRGYVVDMINVLFVNFAVFNVADICVVAGGFAAVAYYLFWADKLEPKSDDQTDAEG